jgi:hypothetical protein
VKIDVLTDKTILAVMLCLLLNCGDLNESEMQQFSSISEVCCSVTPSDSLEKCAVCKASILSWHHLVYSAYTFAHRAFSYHFVTLAYQSCSF